MFDIRKLTAISEAYYQRLLPLLVKDEKSPWYGGIRPDLSDINTYYSASAIAALYFNRYSRYYGDSEVLQNLNLNLECLIRKQFADGIISLADCNIQSPPDTAFVINALAIVYYGAKKSTLSGAASVINNILRFMNNARDAMLVAGIHTPNHRWIVACANAFLYDILGDARQKESAFRYLREGFDATPDGEWTERSNGNYNSCCDLALYHIHEIFGCPDGLCAARRNINMMKFLLHPNGSVVTEYSTRQDRKTVSPMEMRYAVVYKFFANLDNDPEFAWLSDYAAECANEKHYILNYFIAREDEMMRPAESRPIPDKYVKLFGAGRVARTKANSEQGDPVLRYRDGDLSVTVTAGQHDAVFIEYGGARIPCIKFPIGFFGKGCVCFNTIEILGEGRYLMRGAVKHGYFGALPDGEKQELYVDFYRGQHDLRPFVWQQELLSETYLTISGTHIEIKHKIVNMPDIYAQIIFSLDQDTALSGNVERKQNFVKVYDPQCHIKPYHKLYECEGGKFSVEQNGCRFEIDAGICGAHKYLALRGDPIYPDYTNVICNLFTPFDHTVSIDCSKVQNG